MCASGKKPEDYREEVFSRMEAMVKLAASGGFVLLHENEKDIYGDIVDRCADLMDNLYCDNFKTVFDPANFVQCGEDTKECFDALKPYIEYMHIKDARLSDGLVVPPGQGDGQIKTLMEKLSAKKLLGLTEQQLRTPSQTLCAARLPGMRLIPYKTVDTNSGMLLAMMLKDVKIGNRKGSSLVAFAPGELGKDSGFQALVGGTV